MKINKKLIFFIILVTLNVFIFAAGGFPDLIENVYSVKIFPVISYFLRALFSIAPFSVGDVFYAIFIVFIFLKLSILLFKVASHKNKDKKQIIKNIMIKTLTFTLCFYFLFYFLWGLNYNRKGIVEQLGLGTKKYDSLTLITINALLLEKVNETRSKIDAKSDSIKKSLPEAATIAFAKFAKNHPFLHYEQVSIKSSLWGGFMNYTGVTGYYNPFTGEAQVNTSIPYFLQPFVTCHEVAHQLGYAKEAEANFVGFLVARDADDAAMQYSAYLEMFIYANRNLYAVDSSAALIYRKRLSAGVKSDLEIMRKFSRDHQSFIEPLTSWIYDKFLKSNNQPSGMGSYSEVIGYISAYYKKFGTI